MVLISKAGFLKLIRYSRFNLNASVSMVLPLAKERIRWNTSDIELLPDSSHCYEIIDRELLVRQALH